jgi:hypothetical protein
VHLQDFSLETVFLQIDSSAEAGDAAANDQNLIVVHFVPLSMVNCQFAAQLSGSCN